MEEEKLDLPLLKSVKRQKAPLGRSVSTNFVADCRLFTVPCVFVRTSRSSAHRYGRLKSTDAAGSGVDRGGRRDPRKITVPSTLIRCRDISVATLKVVKPEFMRTIVTLCFMYFLVSQISI